jgi:hypothetical protein
MGNHTHSLEGVLDLGTSIWFDLEAIQQGRGLQALSLGALVQVFPPQQTLQQKTRKPKQTCSSLMQDSMQACMQLFMCWQMLLGLQ